MVVDLFLIYQFLRRLVQPFKKWKAYELGVIDENGKVLIPKEKRTKEQNKAWGYFDILVANLKKLLAKFPAGKTRIASFAAALLLLKEHQEGNVLTEDIDEIEKKLINEIRMLNKDDMNTFGVDKSREPQELDIFQHLRHKKIGLFWGYVVFLAEGIAPYSSKHYVNEFVLRDNKSNDIVAIFQLERPKKNFIGFYIKWVNIAKKYRKRGFAKSFYEWLIKKHNYILISDYEQTEGGRKIWIDLYKTRGIYIYAMFEDDSGKLHFSPVEYNRGKLVASHFILYDDEYDEEIEDLKNSWESVKNELLNNPENKVLKDLEKYYAEKIHNLEKLKYKKAKKTYLVATSRKNLSEDVPANTTASTAVIKTAENSEKSLLTKKILKRKKKKKKEVDKRSKI